MLTAAVCYRRRRFPPHVLPAGLFFGLTLALPGPQGARTLTLAAPTASLDVEFTRVAAVRELADGRVLISDEGEKRLFVGDWKTGSVRPIGREGQGPGEYQRPRSLFALAGDSTLLVDALAGRWLLLAGDSIVETIPASAPPLQAGARFPVGADARGFVVATRPIGMPAVNRPPSLPPRLDSLYLIRADRRTGALDTLATLASRTGRISVTGPADRPTRIEVVLNPFSVGDQPVLFPDGWIAIARIAPYAVDWIAPDGRVVNGRALPVERVPITEREKRAILKRQADERGEEPRDPASVRDWPELLPPFLSSAVLPSGDGSLWIRRTATADEPRARYDIVSRSGALVARLQLKDGEHVAGLGRSAVITVHTDGDGIQRLRRHALPGI
ncbi:MAG TPA: 6-bladed beta-propeller [Gemmatimonadaceae bacterium]|nr:6-bladed beta-propeller [Gemmatimonadaceae bacterium]